MALKPTVPPAAPISVSSIRTGTVGNTTINPDARQPRSLIIHRVINLGLIYQYFH